MPTTEYYKAAKQSNTTTHNQGRAKHDSCRTSGVKHNTEATPRHKPAKTKKLTEHWSNHNQPAPRTLHEVRKTTPSGATTDSTKERVIETAVRCLHKTPRENPQSRKLQNTIHEAKPAKPTKDRHD
ncbi:hypothetical protein Taro_050372 [Colocasia esculenta]|uniref:Uncharacterized protein n=1 Tax=Colocasia esculenta TaxID=4460 RepID=A0A843XDS4_COLES|nr:hypothetical protein [Colocasia esculenta]